MQRTLFLIPTFALTLAGCVTGGSNPNCRPAMFADGSSYQVCTVGNVILMERVTVGRYRAEPVAYASPDAADPAPRSEPAAEDAPDAEAGPDEEPVVITSTRGQPLTLTR